MIPTTTEISAALLAEVSLLKVFTAAELNTLISFGKIITFEPHSNIIIEGEQSWGLYIVLSGTAGVYKTNKLTGTSYDLDLLHNGSFFGEVSLVDENPRTTSVRSLTACELFFISKDRFTEFLEKSRDLKLRFCQSCISTLVNRLRELDDNYVVSQYQLWKSALTKGSKP